MSEPSRHLNPVPNTLSGKLMFPTYLEGVLQVPLGVFLGQLLFIQGHFELRDERHNFSNELSVRPSKALLVVLELFGQVHFVHVIISKNGSCFL